MLSHNIYVYKYTYTYGNKPTRLAFRHLCSKLLCTSLYYYMCSTMLCTYPWQCSFTDGKRGPTEQSRARICESNAAWVTSSTDILQSSQHPFVNAVQLYWRQTPAHCKLHSAYLRMQCSVRTNKHRHAANLVAPPASTAQLYWRRVQKHCRVRSTYLRMHCSLLTAHKGSLQSSPNLVVNAIQREDSSQQQIGLPKRYAFRLVERTGEREQFPKRYAFRNIMLKCFWPALGNAKIDQR